MTKAVACANFVLISVQCHLQGANMGGDGLGQSSPPSLMPPGSVSLPPGSVSLPQGNTDFYV